MVKLHINGVPRKVGLTFLMYRMYRISNIVIVWLVLALVNPLSPASKFECALQAYLESSANCSSSLNSQKLSCRSQPLIWHGDGFIGDRQSIEVSWSC